MKSMCTFVDAQLMHRNHPDTFEVPDQDELDNIVPGALVKVCNNFERFWCKVTEVQLDGTISATVDNRLFGKYGYNEGDTVTFHKNNIYSIWYGKTVCS
jgi:hypothetical protein